MIGLGGLYGATSLSGNSRGSAFGAPVSPPDPTNCVPPQVPGEEDANCCPREPHRQDMGYLATAARDPIFFAHH